MIALSTLLGLTLATGLACLMDFFLRGRRRTLTDRLAPHYGHPPAAGALPWRRTRRRRRSTPLERDPEQHAELTARLHAAGLSTDPVAYRNADLLTACLAGAGALALILFTSLTRTVPPIGAVTLVAGAVLLALLLRRRRLDALIRSRRDRLSLQFPAFAELLALAVAAGDALGPALVRCSRGLRGELAEELDITVGQLRSGRVLPAALQELAERAADPALGRCVDAIVAAGERGTPVAGVLRDQAADAREALRRSLMETAGKKEVGMLVPVVFGVLPLSVIFAVFPAAALLNLGV